MLLKDGACRGSGIPKYISNSDWPQISVDVRIWEVAENKSWGEDVSKYAWVEGASKYT